MAWSLALKSLKMKQDKPWQTLDSKVVYQNLWLKVHEDKTQMSNGKEGIYGFIEGGSGVFIIALNKSDEIYLVESFRYPTQKWQWELPTGGLGADTEPVEAAKAELKEELGMIARKWTALNPYGPSHNGFMQDLQYVYVAEELEEGEQKLGDFEAIRAVRAVPLDKLMLMIKDGTFADGQSLAALMQFIVWRGQ
jgi:8-oxo-dGTP pyrophosphatase MutT (NUDIX family)